MDLGSILGSAAGAVTSGGLIGGVLRFAPEVLKYMDRKGDRAHEITMFNLQLEADKLKTQNQLAVINAQHVADADNKDLEAMIAGIGAQAVVTGISWVDAINSLVRPVLTLYWCVVLYTGVLIARYAMLVNGGVGAAEALLHLWGPAEYALMSSMMSFWFVDRSLRKGGGVGAPH